MSSAPALSRLTCWLVSLSGLAVLLIVTTALRCWNSERVFVKGSVYFVDADCYSRMTRVREIQEGTFSSGHHSFENYPKGTVPHTTLPLDLLILALIEVIGDRDIAGAVIGPILGAIGAAFLWVWSIGMRGRWMLLCFYAFSPILVHGTVLGRPDHQALLIVLLAVAMAGEWRISGTAARAWKWITGLSWGVSFWVSFYEPLVLYLLIELLRVIVLRRRWAQEERWVVWSAIVGVLCLALVAERSFWIGWPDPLVFEYFSRWKTTIVELKSVFPWSELLLGWTGFGLLFAPILLGISSLRDRRAFPVLMLLVLAWALTAWQIRWGYFLALIFGMSIPLQRIAIRQRWMAWAVFLVSLWPMASAWENRLFPDQERTFRIRERTLDAILLRDAARAIAGAPRNGNKAVMAPWWLSPPIAYWTGFPAVAGSSHESLAGTLSSARFYLTSSLYEAREILESHRVGWVVAYEPSRVLDTSEQLLDRNADPSPMAVLLYNQPHSAPQFLRYVYGNQSFKVFRVNAPNQK